MTAVSEMARGLAAPSIQPAWDRHILRARNPPHVAFDHHEYDREPCTMAPFFNRGDQIVERAFLFDPPAVSALRDLVAPHVPHCSTFDLIVATMWRARALSLNLDPALNVRVTFPVNARDKFNPPIIPTGYYGNVVTTPAAMATVAELQADSVVRAVELVKKAKNQVSGDYMRSMMDLMAVRGRPPLAMGTTLFITDMRRVGVQELDYGWGRAAYGGPAKGNERGIPGFLSFLQPVRNRNGGECGILVPMSLPEPAMDLLARELDAMMGRAAVDRAWKMSTATLFRWARK
uniref:Benzyl alcohol O-benzoyltransferase n=1 Tax=Kalanchoe fedtschenkoi TaxID=63787 RepID=A0A7N0VKD9_KALFE